MVPIEYLQYAMFAAMALGYFALVGFMAPTKKPKEAAKKKQSPPPKRRKINKGGKNSEDEETIPRAHLFYCLAFSSHI